MSAASPCASPALSTSPSDITELTARPPYALPDSAGKLTSLPAKS